MLDIIRYLPSLVHLSEILLSGRFDEDGSWIGVYGTNSKKDNKKRISNELTAASAAGATYV